VAGGEQPPDHHRADVTGAAGDDRPHAGCSSGLSSGTSAGMCASADGSSKSMPMARGGRPQSR
jgi:hypothetical protein